MKAFDRSIRRHGSTRVAAALSIAFGCAHAPRLTDEVRSGLPGSFVALGQGTVCYERSAGGTGRDGSVPVVLVHGATGGKFVWDRTAPSLAERGLEVVRYDLYGRGFSDRPDADHGPDLYDRQLSDLVSALDLATPVDLVGVSLGGAIATVFCDRHPELVRRLVLISPAGLESPSPVGLALIRAPLLGEFIDWAFGRRILEAGLDRMFLSPERFPEFRDQTRDQMRFAGYREALLSTVRCFPIDGLEPSIRRIGESGRPILLLWGEDDRVIPLSAHRRFLDLLPNARFRAIPGAGHISAYERPDLVNPLILEFLEDPGGEPPRRAEAGRFDPPGA